LVLYKLNSIIVFCFPTFIIICKNRSIPLNIRLLPYLSILQAPPKNI
jgi:hypothetical protein